MHSEFDLRVRQVAIHPDPHEAKRLIESSSKIHMRPFQIIIGVLTGLAFCCFILRIFVRLKYQKQLRLDDAFIVLAAICLCVATGNLYHICQYLYLHSAAVHVPELLPLLLSEFDKLRGTHKKVYPFLAMIWTTTFAVRGCFLAFMRPLVWHISRAMNWYYWFVVVFSILSWAFVVANPFNICPYYGVESVKCFTSTVAEEKTLGLTSLVTVLDVLSDIMIVSLPIIVLWGSHLSRSTKFGLAVFLCLSIFMAICALIRIIGFHYKGIEDDVWPFFWQQTEGSIAVMMASITAFRTLFVKPDTDGDDIKTPRSPIESFYNRMLRRFRSLAQAKPSEKPSSNLTAQPKSFIKLPRMPAPTFSSVRSFIRRNNRTNVSNTGSGTLNSATDVLVEDYHAVLKGQRGSSRDETSSHT
ncbi:unnamed protein product [Periconia digitata]|uniref:Rhodopsin domain-containing protein n=1 Tax=Periconia digitata TaxID=1303443 RepID=A0A9W4XRK7_9PLEO|nr:unnamed protein product [Periconia digitata]